MTDPEPKPMSPFWKYFIVVIIFITLAVLFLILKQFFNTPPFNWNIWVVVAIWLLALILFLSLEQEHYWKIAIVLLVLYLLIGPIFNIVYKGVTAKNWMPEGADFNPSNSFERFKSLFSKAVFIDEKGNVVPETIIPENDVVPSTEKRCKDNCNPRDDRCDGNTLIFCALGKDDCYQIFSKDCSDDKLICGKERNGVKYDCFFQGYLGPTSRPFEDAKSVTKLATYGLGGTGIIVLLGAIFIGYHLYSRRKGKTRRGPPSPPTGAGAADRTGGSI